METIGANTMLGRILAWCRQEEASDLHGQAGRPFCIRVHGRLRRVPESTFPAPGPEELWAWLREGFTAGTCDRIEREQEVDLSFYHGHDRYRANFSS